MSNSFFKYKQFTIHQDKTAQKVCTDTSLFGALIEPNDSHSVLDIGTGTGVLALMLAQKTQGRITAVEIEPNAFEQAKGNAGTSQWADRVEVVHADILHYANDVDSKFDLIISNPPFFQNSHRSKLNEKNLARHNDSLSLSQLADCVVRLLSEHGMFWVILPEYESGILRQDLELKNIYAVQNFNILNYIGDDKISRVVSSYSFGVKVPEKKEIAIYLDKDREYTNDFIKLLKPYYLYL